MSSRPRRTSRSRSAVQEQDLAVRRLHVKGPVRRYRAARVTSYCITNREGRYLVDVTKTPFVWDDRKPIVFLSREEADRFIARKFVGVRAAREMGIRVKAL